ncbi:hypothetical protein N1851_026138 [Merluccius polli]|uniref:Uncharacterized protein n=1 Tax=Merluccius polli TaxID=89951 RepID=A0AA47MCJ3_MERPO|nr:hypothetical protein N1851_026138 [Merluccius polli]
MARGGGVTNARCDAARVEMFPPVLRTLRPLNSSTLTCLRTLNKNHWRHDKRAPPVLGIDGPAAFLAPEAPDSGSKNHILSVSQPRTTTQSPPASQQHHHHHHPPAAAAASVPGQSQSPVGEEPERDGDTESLLEPKTDLHELLQKRVHMLYSAVCEYSREGLCVVVPGNHVSHLRGRLMTTPWRSSDDPGEHKCVTLENISSVLEKR